MQSEYICRLHCHPTHHPPGSPEKVAVIAQRYEEGRELHHVDDAREAVVQPEIVDGWTDGERELRLEILSDIQMAARSKRHEDAKATIAKTKCNQNAAHAIADVGRPDCVAGQ